MRCRVRSSNRTGRSAAGVSGVRGWSCRSDATRCHTLGKSGNCEFRYRYSRWIGHPPHRPAPPPDAARPTAATAGAALAPVAAQLEAFCTVSMAGSVSGAAQAPRAHAVGDQRRARRARGRAGHRAVRAGRTRPAPDDAPRAGCCRARSRVVERAGELPAVAAGVPGRRGAAARRRFAHHRPVLMPDLLGRSRPLARRRGRADRREHAELLARLHRLSSISRSSRATCPPPAWSSTRAPRCAVPARTPAIRSPNVSAPDRARSARRRTRVRSPGPLGAARARIGGRARHSCARRPVIGAPRASLTVDDPSALLPLLAAGDWIGCASRLAASEASPPARCASSGHRAPRRRVRWCALLDRPPSRPLPHRGARRTARPGARPARAPRALSRGPASPESLRRAVPDARRCHHGVRPHTTASP